MVNKVKGKLEDLARERALLSAEKAALQKEKAGLKEQVTDLASAVQKLNREKVALELSLEAEEEQVWHFCIDPLSGIIVRILC